MRKFTISHFSRGYSKKFLLFLMLLISFYSGSTQTTITSWVGNSWGKTNVDPNWVQNDIRGMYVTPSGTIYTASNWDEGGRECAVYSTNGLYVDQMDDTHAKTWHAVAVGNNYVFQGYINGFQRYNLDGTKNGSLVVVKSNATEDVVRGLAINAVANELYVNNFPDGQIRVYNTSTLALIRQWNFSNGGQMSFDGTNLWAVQNKNIVKMSSTGTVLATITTVGRPNGLWCDNLGSGGTARLLVADTGPDQQIKIFNISTSTPSQTGTFGTQYGITSGTPGQCAPLKLDGPSAVATDAAGNIYVACRGNLNSLTAPEIAYSQAGLVLRKFNSAGTMQWEREGLHFVEVATTDPADETKVYTPYHIYNMNYGPNGGGQEWSHISSTMNVALYPFDARVLFDKKAAKAIVRTFGGNKYLYVGFFELDMFAVYKMDGQIAKPCIVRADNELSPFFENAPTAAGYWYWQDNNGDGRMQANEYRLDGNTDIGWLGSEPDNNGNLWKCTWDTKAIEYIPLQSVNSFGVPIYASTPTAVPYTGALANDITRVRYVSATNTMYLAGANTGYGKFKKVIKYSDWTGARTIAWTITVPQDYFALDVEGSYVFLGYTDFARVPDPPEGGQVEIRRDADGSLLTTLNALGPELGGEIGWFDFNDCIDVFKKANGEYNILAEDDGYSKSVLWRWTPPNVAVSSVTVSPTSATRSVGTMQQLVATVLPANANQNVTWSSSNSSIASVNASGLVTALAPGSATITVTSVADGTKTATSVITVTSAGGSCNTTLISDNFDSGFGNWVDGGTDAARINNATYSYSGTFSAQLRDNTATSVISTNNTNLTSYSSVEVSFTYTTVSMEAGEDFWLQLSNDGGSTYSTVKAFVSGTDFTNGTRYFPTVTVNGSFTSTSRLRFRNDASADDDVVYLDNIVVKGCTGGITTTIFDNTDPGWTWSGYTLDACATCYGGSAHSSPTVGHFGQRTFTGNKVEAYCETWNGAGSVEIFVDNISKGIFSQSITPYGGAVLFATISNLAEATHTIKFVQKNSSWAGIDYIKVFSTSDDLVLHVAQPENLTTSDLGETEITIFPNPVKDIFTLRISGVNESVLQLQMVDVTGRSIYKTELLLQKSRTEYVVKPALKQGVYFLVIKGQKTNKTLRMVFE